jgi:hypothetical protein
MTATDESMPCAESLAALVAIARAAHISGDRSLARAARRELLDRYGIDLSFRRLPTTKGTRDAN